MKSKKGKEGKKFRVVREYKNKCSTRECLGNIIRRQLSKETSRNGK